jgi:hypothetical protein
MCFKSPSQAISPDSNHYKYSLTISLPEHLQLPHLEEKCEQMESDFCRNQRPAFVYGSLMPLACRNLAGTRQERGRNAAGGARYYLLCKCDVLRRSDDRAFQGRVSSDMLIALAYLSLYVGCFGLKDTQHRRKFLLAFVLLVNVDCQEILYHPHFSAATLFTRKACNHVVSYFRVFCGFRTTLLLC